MEPGEKLKPGGNWLYVFTSICLLAKYLNTNVLPFSKKIKIKKNRIPWLKAPERLICELLARVASIPYGSVSLSKFWLVWGASGRAPFEWNQILEFIDGYLCIRRVGCMMDYLFAHYEWKGTDGITWNSTAHEITDEYHVNIGCL